MPLNPLLILGLFLCIVTSMFVVLAYGFDFFLKAAADKQVEALIAIAVGLFINWVGIKLRADYWEVWSDDNGYKVLDRKRAWFKPGIHKASWLLKNVWAVKIQTKNGVKEAWVTTDRRGFPDECVWIAENIDS